MILEIRGYNLPGLLWHIDGEPCDKVHVGVQLRREPSGLVSGDRESALWTVPVDLQHRDDGIDFHGPAVQGRRGDRFVYLTWGNVGADGSFTMFRRAKLMLADVKPLLVGDGQEQRIVATVDLTDDCGGPRCARLRPPALVLTSAHPG